MTSMRSQDDAGAPADTADPGAKDQPAEGGRAEAEDTGPGNREQGSSGRRQGSSGSSPGSPSAQQEGIVERGPQPERVTTDDADAGAYVGRLPEGQAETIPGGVSDEDERVSAYDSRRDDVNEPPSETRGSWPEGHREGDQATDDDVRRAGDQQ